MANVSDNESLKFPFIDPELDRLYREHAIAASLIVQTPPMVEQTEEEKEISNLEPLDKCSSTF